MTAASGKTVGEVLADAGAMRHVVGIMSEVLGIAALEGVDRPADAREAALAKARARLSCCCMGPMRPGHW